MKRLFVFILILSVAATAGFFLLRPKILNFPSARGDYFQVSIPPFVKIVDVEGAELFLEDELTTFILTENVFKLTYFRPGLFMSKGTVEFSVVETAVDGDSDGYPDDSELYGEDCRRFREWMVWIAKAQKIRYADNWKQIDCSGLIRFCAVEALKRHDSQWNEAFGSQAPNLEDVKAFNYPEVPVLGSQIFQVSDGFYGFADARNLLLYSCRRIGDDYTEGKMGDLLFFYHPQDNVFPYHVVMLTDDGFVYHTGPSDEDEGELRLWKEAVYFDAAPLIWLPVKENPSFLGVYRFRFLND
ncbi:MAG TPA: DUF1175 family protein [Thermotogota bacterium]|nr:DUF1175 family protein [Thermotogota bacterium]HPJ89260.1 DUF1175 family protein [Thermotogota bacterium]HPR96448.1 DUF1175 family protein [Thermotogota bacterium]